MKPLIVAATEGEIAPSLDFLNKLEIPYLITGVGMTATAYQLGKKIAQYRPDYILNVGIAGSIAKDIPLGTVVHLLEDHFAELGAEDDERFISLEELGLGNSSFQAAVPSHLSISLPQEVGVTVNTVHGNEASIQKLKQRIPTATIESMEGAAVFYVCHEERVPCIQIRSISNYVEKRNRVTWNIPLAIKNLNKWLQGFLEEDRD